MFLPRLFHLHRCLGRKAVFQLTESWAFSQSESRDPSRKRFLEFSHRFLSLVVVLLLLSLWLRLLHLHLFVQYRLPLHRRFFSSLRGHSRFFPRHQISFLLLSPFLLHPS